MPNQFDPWEKRGRCEPGHWPGVDGQSQEAYRQEGFMNGPHQFPDGSESENDPNNMMDRRYGPVYEHNKFGYGNSGTIIAGYEAPLT